MKAHERNVSLDVLRCLLMFGVVLQHTFAVCKFGGVIPYSAIIVADSLTHPSVDGFTAISGWFGGPLYTEEAFQASMSHFFLWQSALADL